MQKLTKEQATIIISGYTRITCCNFNLIHEDVEKCMGHPVWSHQFGYIDFVEKFKF